MIKYCVVYAVSAYIYRSRRKEPRFSLSFADMTESKQVSANHYLLLSAVVVDGFLNF